MATISNSQGIYVSRPIGSLEEDLTERMLKLVQKRDAEAIIEASPCTWENDIEQLRQKSDPLWLLRRQLQYLQRLLSTSHHYATRTLFTIALTEMALKYAGQSATHWGLRPCQGHDIVAPLLLQPAFLVAEQPAENVLETKDDRCCPGHCGEGLCIEFCINSIMEYMHVIQSPFCAFTKAEINEALFPDSHSSPESRAGMTLAEEGVDKVARLLLERVLGEMTDFTHAPARLAGFCRCEKTIQQLERLPPLAVPGRGQDDAKVDMKKSRSRMHYHVHDRSIWGR